MNIYEYSVFDSKGNEISLADFQNKIIMIVNTATGCSFTPQYKAIESLYEKYHKRFGNYRYSLQSVWCANSWNG